MKYALKDRFVPGGGTHYAIGISRDGTKILLGSTDGVYKSVDSGLSWTKTAAPAIGWNQLAISDDGNYIYAQGNSNWIHISSNGGTSFAHKTTGIAQDNNHLVCSTTGQYVYLTSFIFGASYVYTSSDYGNTFTQRSGPTSIAKHALDCSSDGRYAVVGSVDSGLYTSADFGVNWTVRSNAGNRSWYGANISDDGTKLAVGVYNSGIFTSTDSGANWTQRASTKYWIDLHGSSDGTKLIAYGDNVTNTTNTEFWTSSDSGVNWTDRTSLLGNLPDQWGQHSDGEITTDGAGNHYVTVRGQFLKKSTDNGASWISLDANYDFGKQFNSIAVSGDGNVGFANEASASRLHISTDGLQTWAYTEPMRRSILDCSYDGSKVLGILNTATTYSGGGPAPNKPTVSSNYGQTWTDVTGAATKEYSLGCMSWDGTTMYLADPTTISRSQNSGSSWTVLGQTVTSYWGWICCSSDGTKVYAVDNSPGYIYTSTNSGTGFTQRTGPGSRGWASVACSEDGTVVYAVADSALVYKSTDSGVTWNTLANSGTNGWFSVTCSANGQRVFATAFDANSNTPVYCSFDGGTTWTLLFTSIPYQYTFPAIAGSANLRKIMYGMSFIKSGDLVEAKLPFMI